MITPEKNAEDLKNINNHLTRTDQNLIDVEARLNKRIDSLKESVLDSYNNLGIRISKLEKSVSIFEEWIEREGKEEHKELIELKNRVDDLEDGLEDEPLVIKEPKKSPFAFLDLFKRRK